MKKNVLWGLAGAALFCACQSNTKITIKGTLTGLENDTLIAVYEPITGFAESQKDTFVLQQGRFSFEIKADTLPVAITIYPMPSGNKAFNMMETIKLLAFPGDALTIEGTLDENKVAGSDFYIAYNEWDKKQKPLNDSIKSIINTAMQMRQNGASQDSVMKIMSILPNLQERFVEQNLEYIRQHPDEELSVYLIMLTGDKLPEALDLLSDKAKNGRLAPIYQSFKNIVEEQQAKEKAKESVAEGKPAPDFTLKDLQGKDLSLSSLRGKYVVLDFWGSWCGWCIKGIPEMKKYYEKYKGKLEILGIDCRDTEEKWKEAVKEHKLPWLHVRNEGNPDVSVLYAIEGYPTKIVVDPEGKIAKVVVGEDPAFYEYLDELFK